VLKIGNVSAEYLTHNQARETIVRQGNNLELTLQRGDVPKSEDYRMSYQFPQHQLMTPENLETKPKLSPQVGLQVSKNKALLTQAYNSPMGLYSNKNIVDTLVTSIKNGSNTSLCEQETILTPTTKTILTPNSVSSITSKSLADFNPKPKPFLLKQTPTQNTSINEFRTLTVQVEIDKRDENLDSSISMPSSLTSSFTQSPLSANTLSASISRNHSPKSILTHQQSFNTEKSSIENNKNAIFLNTSATSLNKNGLKIERRLSNGLLLLKEIEKTMQNNEGSKQKSNKENLDETKDEKKPQVTHKKVDRSLYAENNKQSANLNQKRDTEKVKTYVGTLDEPRRPSLTQSRTFRLLQEALNQDTKQGQMKFNEHLNGPVELRRFSLNAKSNQTEEMLNNNLKIKFMSKAAQSFDQANELSKYEETNRLKEKRKIMISTRSMSLASTTTHPAVSAFYTANNSNFFNSFNEQDENNNETLVEESLVNKSRTNSLYCFV